MKHLTALFFTLIILLPIQANPSPKREFRGAWIQTAYQSRYAAMNEQEMKSYWVSMLDSLQKAGINAIIFQIRPQADAFYISKIEPFSRFFTGKQGLAPTPLWDPLQFMITQAHLRNMELHAWINPYRVTNNENEELSPNHIYYQHPEWFVRYGKQLYFDPGLPQSRNYICDVIADIVTRYDIDAIHTDDYFYPYPITGIDFPDKESFATYAADQGFLPNQKNDWRRNNTNLLIERIHNLVREIKPWVQFGVSPFGIYRNAKNTPDGKGSQTDGLQNYDDLYADVLLWSKNGWIDYIIPQLYWEIGHPKACYETLIHWWGETQNATEKDKCHLYIGQSLSRSADAKDLNPIHSQLNRKIELSRYINNIGGNCFWHGYEIAENYKGVATELQQKQHILPSLIPAYTQIDATLPAEVKSLQAKWTADGYQLQWKARNTRNKMQEQQYFCIYAFKDGENINLDNSSKIVAVTRKNSYKLPYIKGNQRYIYIVTALDRLHNESPKGSKIKLKL